MKTHVVRARDIEHKWVLIDAEGRVLGRVASHVANLLRGKGKPQYTPHLDQGDHVVVTNAAKVRITGDKLQQKKYYKHSGYPGGLRVRSMRELMESRPEEVIMRAVRGMLPATKLGRAQLTRLRVYAGPEHRQQAQSPAPFELE
ncbi:MAG TPA: 50S ribosomal protein L13 [Candidatus Krumholzibacteria bacterium]|jgi:large subunit ribosomal protein L13|nr:50S ribosomal protein L13 [Candidatus Krumholzibacteria bacterium]